MEYSNPNESFVDYLDTVFVWKSALDEYTQTDLETKPTADIWSLAQVYDHWLDASQLYMLGKVKSCLEFPQKHIDGELSPLGVQLLTSNEFPVVEAKVPGNNDYQPRNEGENAVLLGRIQQLTEYMEATNEVLKSVQESGKSGHRFFGFMNAHQWYRLIPIHIRHHFRQRAKIDTFLNRSN